MAHTKITTRNITDDAVTSAKLDTNIDIAGTLDVTGATTLDSNLTVGANDNEETLLTIRYSTVPAYISSTYDGTSSISAFSANQYNTDDGSASLSSAANTAYANAALKLYSGTGDSSIRFYTATAANTNPTEYMRLDHDGKVGIGTTTPTNVLDLGAATLGRGLTFTKYSNLFSEYSNASFWLASNFYGNAGASGYKTGATGNFGAAGIRVHGTGDSLSGIIEFYVDANSSKTADAAFTPTKRMMITSDGHLIPGADNAYDLGSTSARWRNVYTTDLHLSNMIPEGTLGTDGKAMPKGNDVDGTTGDWTIQEGAEDLFLVNNNTGKKYKFNLTEV